MNPQLMHLLLLAHLSGVARGIQHATAPRQQADRFGNQSAPVARAAPKQNQKLQGNRGVSQGRHGAKGPVQGGIASMLNAHGLFPHQQNPTMFAMQALSQPR